MNGYRVTVEVADGDGSFEAEQGGVGPDQLPAKLREIADRVEAGEAIRLINIEQPKD